MSRILIRYGLWAFFAIILLAIARESLQDTSPLRSTSGPLLQNAFAGAIIAVGVGVILYLIEKVFGAPKSARCASCRQRIFKGEIYCRNHLRQIIHEEDDRAHEIPA